VGSSFSERNEAEAKFCEGQTRGRRSWRDLRLAPPTRCAIGTMEVVDVVRCHNDHRR